MSDKAGNKFWVPNGKLLMDESEGFCFIMIKWQPILRILLGTFWVNTLGKFDIVSAGCALALGHALILKLAIRTECKHIFFVANRWIQIALLNYVCFAILFIIRPSRIFANVYCIFIGQIYYGLLFCLPGAWNINTGLFMDNLRIKLARNCGKHYHHDGLLNYKWFMRPDYEILLHLFRVTLLASSKMIFSPEKWDWKLTTRWSACTEFSGEFHGKLGWFFPKKYIGLSV